MGRGVPWRGLDVRETVLEALAECGVGERGGVEARIWEGRLVSVGLRREGDRDGEVVVRGGKDGRLIVYSVDGDVTGVRD